MEIEGNAWRTSEERGQDGAGEAAENDDAERLQTPTIGGNGWDESELETPRARVDSSSSSNGEERSSVAPRYTRPVLAMAALSLTSSSPRSSLDNIDVAATPATARPEISSRKSSLATITSSKSPDLYEMASMYQPDEPTSLVVADATGGYFQNVNLSTPTVERFEVLGGASEWSNGFHRAAIANGSGTGRSSNGHRRNASEASNASASSSTAAQEIRRASWYAPSTSQAREEVSQRHQSQDIAYNPRKSESSSSIAESVGTAGDATDSEYEDQRSRSHSRQGSRRPSAANLPSLAGKRLSSFAPIADISRNSSQTNIATNGHEVSSSRGPFTVTSPQTSPPLDQSWSRRSQTLSPDAVPSTSSSMTASTSAQSSASSASSTGSADPTKAWQSVKGKQMEITGIGNKPENAPPPGKRRKHKPSPMDKVMSKTRPRDLPPKARDEDVSSATWVRAIITNETHFNQQRHLKEYEEMLVLSKAAEKRRQAVMATKQREKEKLADEALPTWEKQILPNWKAVLRDDKLRRIWWSGTMPPRHRARLWQGCIGNGLALSKGASSPASRCSGLLIANQLRTVGLSR